ncbi:VCBS repeat-containing protein [bacterium]|nr:VCBS repeat-containing protein [bacterium]
MVLGAAAAAEDVRQYVENPFVIALDIPAPTDSAGGLIAADLDGDGRRDYLITVPGHVAAYGHDGQRLWVRQVPVQVGGSSESHGLPGHHGPGVTAGDIDGDGTTEVLFLTRDGFLRVLTGRTGKDKWQARIPSPEGTERWEHLVLADFRGMGDRDLLLQATNKQGYRMGRFVAAFALEELARGRVKPLWQRDDFLACAHNGARVADLDGDGRDEVLGGTILSCTGRIITRIPLRGHIDSIFVDDVRPDLPGLEVVALEEGGGNRVFLYGIEGLIWESHYNHQEPQNAALGEFDPGRPGLEIWCRSRYDTHQKPWVFSSTGEVISHYEMDRVAPKDWTAKGVEVIHTIDWTGRRTRLASAKARHESGDVCIFDPISGKFIKRFPEQADRLYVADVAGDGREEILVLRAGSCASITTRSLARGNAPSPWAKAHYRKSKLTWNYYSP